MSNKEFIEKNRQVHEISISTPGNPSSELLTLNEFLGGYYKLFIVSVRNKNTEVHDLKPSTF